MRYESMHPDFVVVGAGVAGLSIAKKLVDEGHRVIVTESSQKIASGASTRNEGWLHAGTYHSLAIEIAAERDPVVERTRYGYQQILEYAPQAIEDGNRRHTYAVIHDPELADRALQEWTQRGIYHRYFRPRELVENVPELIPDYWNAAFAVADKSINVRILAAKLQEDILRGGGVIYTHTQFTPTDDEHGYLKEAGRSKHIVKANAFIIAAGVGTKQLFETYTKTPFPMRYFKSHLVVGPRLGRDNVVALDRGEAGVMHHGRTSIIGMNRDGIIYESPDYEVIADKEQLLKDAVARLLRTAKKHEDTFVPIACLKPDIYSGEVSDGLQSLNVRIGEPAPNYIYALPGKMTEAPALARDLVEYLYSRTRIITPGAFPDGAPLHRITVPIISQRPADNYRAN